MSLADTVTDGPLIAAVGISALAGLVSFLSPCVLPLVPGYVSYVTGIAGADLDAATGTDPSGRRVEGRHGATETAVAVHERRRVRGRVLLGTGLFVAGFTAVFTVIGMAVGGLGATLLEHREAAERIVGAVIVLLGVAFLGLLPGAAREFRLHSLPAGGLLGAPLLGAVFGLGWIPCVSPTLAAVQGLAYVQGGVVRGAILSVAYCVGLGLPFVAFGLGFRRLLGALKVVRTHSRWVTRAGGVLLIVVGLVLLLGVWDDAVIALRDLVGPGEIGI